MDPQEKEWNLKREDGAAAAASEEKKLELRLGPPGEENWSSSSIGGGAIKKNRDKENEYSLLSLGYFSSSSMNNNGKQQTQKFPSAEDHNNSARPVVGSSVLSGPWTKTKHHQQQTTKSPPFLQSLPPVTAMESSQPWCTKAVDLQKQQQLQQKTAEKKAFSSPANTAVSPCTSQKRTAPGPVVGWPPIRSFRKNLCSSSSKQALDQSQNVLSHNEKTAAEFSIGKGLFVKINMDGVPIGRKVDLKAYDSYEKLSTAVDDLFRGLLAAQRDSSAGGIVNKREEEIKAITGVLDGSGDYTLVYEDNEGDRMLVGDVPWHMFVSTVKRLRVLKSSELSALSLRSK